MAARYGASVEEVHLDHRRVDFHAVARASDQVSPLRFYDFHDVAADRYARDETRLADALFYGVGGDNVFMQSAGIYPVLDYARDRGFDLGLLRVAACAMRDSRQSALHVARAAVRELLSPKPAFGHVYPHLFSGVTDPASLAIFLPKDPAPTLSILC